MTNKKNSNSTYAIILGILLFTLLFSVLVYEVTVRAKRRIFIFPSADSGKYIVETRFLSRNPASDDITYYIEELLLGSGVERTKKIFTLGTKVETCFLRGNTLYLDLSKELLTMDGEVVEIEEGVKLLKKNVLGNFHRVHKIELFVDGKYAYEEI